MSRVLVAGARTPRGEGPAALMKRENEALAQFYGCLADLSLLAWQVRDLTNTNARLKPKLDDPALRDHPKRPEYVAAFETRDLQIRVLKQKADPFLREFAAIWQRLPEQRRERMYREETGFPQERQPVRLAHRVFAWMASSEFLWPSRSEAPFGWLVLFGAIGVLRACVWSQWAS